MNGITRCRNKCDLRRKSKGVNRAYCVDGILPSTCQDCCKHKDTGCYCDRSCMKSIARCQRECPVMNIAKRTYCTDLGKGWENIPERALIPRECEECCPGCENVEDTEDSCPDEITCTTKCVLKKWSSFYQGCLEDYSEEINTKCVEKCKAEAERISSPDDCEPLTDCQATCCTDKKEEYFNKCWEEYDEDESLECIEECVNS
jgi:hypothetical protein